MSSNISIKRKGLVGSHSSARATKRSNLVTPTFREQRFQGKKAYVPVAKRYNIAKLFGERIISPKNPFHAFISILYHAYRVESAIGIFKRFTRNE
jgi:hypothetical protein